MGSYQCGGNFEDPDNFDELIEALRALPWNFDIRETKGESAEVDGKASKGAIEDLTPITSLEELRTLFVSANEANQKRRLIEFVMSRVIAAFCILTGIGIGVYIIAGNITVLLVTLGFFLALIFRFLKLVLIHRPFKRI